MKKTYIWDTSAHKMTEVKKARERKDSANLIMDLEPFMNTDGTFIKSRTHWRQHLKATECVEMGHSDIKCSQDLWNKKKQLHHDKLRNSAKFIKEHTEDVGEVRKSNLDIEVANKLYNRPVPGRREMIQLTMETMKRMNHRG